VPQPKTYFLRLLDREEGPFTDEHVAQMFADGKVNRDTSCKIAGCGDWKTVDDYLPMLKYGTQLPAPTPPVVRSEDPPAWSNRPTMPIATTSDLPTDARVKIVDVDVPFS